MLSAILDDIKEQGYLLTEESGEISLCKIVVDEVNEYKKDWKGEKIIRFGMCGDNQCNSKYTQITHLHAFYDLCETEGIADVYHTGDIDEGEQMRQGHQYECYSQGADDHVDNIARTYPVRKGTTTHFITGNHDHSIIKRCGYDIGYAISAKRPDMKYLGQSSAFIYLTPNCTLELRHPIDGTAYAISYKIQKMVEAMQGGEKPSIFAVGHYHKSEYLFYRNVHCIQTGCFQAQTPWMRGKGISASVGGWIIEARVDEEGTITRFTQSFIPYYKMIKDDYRNWM
jgi:UDP-2,3-diacylglucosamine pyrophosphatase LpxH